MSILPLIPSSDALLSTSMEPRTLLPSSKESKIQDPLYYTTQTHGAEYDDSQSSVQDTTSFYPGPNRRFRKTFPACGGGLCSICLEARAMGVGLKELQLQLISFEGSLTGAFAMRTQRYSNESIRVRAIRNGRSWNERQVIMGFMQDAKRLRK